MTDNNLQQSRCHAGGIVSVVGMALNLLLAAAKITAGILTGLISVTADGVNNLSDCGGGAVTWVSFRISAKPADREHPFGHRRAEYIAALLISFLVLTLAVELFRSSLEKILSGADYATPYFLYAILAASVAVKAGLFVVYRRVARKIGSDALRTAAVDSLCDCIATAAVLIGLLVSAYTSFPADGWAGIAVSLFIAWEGIGFLKDACSKLIGTAPDPKIVTALKAEILRGEGVLGLHDLRVFGYGPEKSFATVHIEMDASFTADFLHERIDLIERNVQSRLGIDLTAHLDPVRLDDEEARELEARVRAAVEGMTEGLNLHDFRLVRGARNKLVFEAAIPFSCKKKNREVENDILRAVRLLCDYDISVTVERE